MNLEALQQLASRQEKGLTDEQIVALSPTQISMLQDGIKAGKIHISDDKMALMSLMQEVHSSSPFESKNPANLAAILSETNIPKLSSEQLGKISISLARNFVSSEQWKRVLDGLSREQLQGLTPFAAAKFSPEDLSRLTPEKRQVLQGKIDEFKRQFSEITYAQAQLLESGHLEHLDAAHIKALINRDRLSWIPMKALEGMPHTSAPKFREYLEQLIPSQREIMKIKLKIYDASH
jgi:hypothetical protein